jgi:hypothetical protein
LKGEWQGGFERALQAEGALMAVPNTDAGVSDFTAKWHDARPSTRVFISFTRADVGEAMKVRTVLEQRGYTVFTYLKSEANPQFSPEAVGKFFRTAGHHLVLDTNNARRSYGVLLEARYVEAVSMAAGGKEAREKAVAGEPARPPRKPVAEAVIMPIERPTLKPSSSGCVECYCGPRYLGCLPPSACIDGMPCR